MQIYELATSSSPVDCYASGEASSLREPTTLRGPLPQGWIDSLGTEIRPRNSTNFLIDPTGESYSPSDHGTSLEQKIRSSSEGDDTWIICIASENLRA